MSEIQRNKNSNDSNEDIKVPVGDNSVIQLVNGGVKLLNGVEQLFFVTEDFN